MSVVFWLLLILVIILVWFLMAFAFRPIGKFFCRLWKDAAEAMDLYDNESEDNKNE